MLIFSTSISVLSANLCLLFVRLTAGAFMLIHGLPKLNKLTSSSHEIKFEDPFGFGPLVSLGLAVFAEVICTIFIILGLGTRLASIPLIITMGVAAFYVHAGDPFSMREKSLLFFIVFVMLCVFGSGRYSIDRLVTKNSAQLEPAD